MRYSRTFVPPCGTMGPAVSVGTSVACASVGSEVRKATSDVARAGLRPSGQRAYEVMMHVLLSCSLVLCFAATALAQDKLAVMPLAAKRVDKSTVEILDALLVNAVDRVRRYKVISTQDVNAILGLDKMKDALGCSDVSCAAEIGGALGVDFLLTGSVSKLGPEVFISLTLLNTKRAEVAARAEASATNDEAVYAHAVRVAVARLLGLPEPSGEGAGANDVAQQPAATAVSPEQTPIEATPEPALGGLIISTQATEHAYVVKMRSLADASVRECSQPVSSGAPCALSGVPAGPVVVELGAPFDETHEVTIHAGDTHGVEIQPYWSGVRPYVGPVSVGLGLGAIVLSGALAGDLAFWPSLSELGVGHNIAIALGWTMVGSGAVAGGLAWLLGRDSQEMYDVDAASSSGASALAPTGLWAVPLEGGAMAGAGFSF